MLALALSGAPALAVAAPRPTPPPSATPTPRVLTEVQILDITCTGARITQTGLPPGDRFRIVVSDPAPTTRVLASVVLNSDLLGGIDIHVAFQRGAAKRLHVEVEDLDRGAEYGETGTDLTTTCGGASGRRWLWAGGGAAVVLAGIGLAVHRRRRRSA